MSSKKTTSAASVASTAKSQGPVCSICLETCTKQAHRKEICCTHCGEGACVRCLQQYIATSIEDPHCPTCRKAWTYDYICETFPKTWYNGEFKKRREAILMDRERSRLPESQPWAERMHQAIDIHMPAILQLKREKCEQENNRLLVEYKKESYKNLHSLKVYERKVREKRDLKAETKETKEEKAAREKAEAEERKEYTQKMKELNEEQTEYGRVVHQYWVRIQNAEALYNNLLTMSDEQLLQHQDYERIRAQVRAENPHIDRATEQALIQSIIATIDYKKTVARTFTMKCPGAECRGFLSTAYKCGICERSTCAQCLIQYPIDDPKGDAHTCSENDKKTVEEIKKSCRNCPSCGMSIYRIEGCNQMFCTACNTAFDWATGAMLNTRQIHNPHYTDYLRRTGQRPTRATAADYNACVQNGVMLQYHNYLDLYYYPIYEVSKNIYPGNYQKDSHEDVMKRETKTQLDHAAEVVRLCTHLSTVESRELQTKLNEVRSNQKLNAEYLAGIYTQDEWKKRIMENEVKRLAYNDAIQNVDAFLAVCADLYANFYHLYSENLKSIPNEVPLNFKKVFQPHNKEAIKRAFAVKEGKAALETHFFKFMELYADLNTQVKELIALMNSKMESIIKTYKVKLNCYVDEKDKYNDNRHYRPIQKSYTALYGSKPKGKIQTRPAAADSESDDEQ